MRVYFVLFLLFMGVGCWGQQLPILRPSVRFESSPIKAKLFDPVELFRMRDARLWTPRSETAMPDRDAFDGRTRPMEFTPSVPPLKPGMVYGWKYRMDTSFVRFGPYQDSVKSVGHIDFWAADTTVSMGFDIYDVSHLAYCYSLSARTMVSSSCMEPNAGGDVFVAGRFVFVNRSPCVRCEVARVDCCRPMMKYVFGRLAGGPPIAWLSDLVAYMPIPAGQ